jgi:hypothetical protein
MAKSRWPRAVTSCLSWPLARIIHLYMPLLENATSSPTTDPRQPQPDLESRKLHAFAQYAGLIRKQNAFVALRAHRSHNVVNSIV